MQSAPRPPASVSLGGSLRASRAAQLARPAGPLAAVDLADGRPLVAELRDGLWVALDEGSSTLELPVAPAPERPPPVPAPARGKRLGVAAVVAVAFGATAVALVTGFSGSPAPAVAAPGAQPRTLRAPVVSTPARPVVRPSRGGRAVALRARPGPPAPPVVPASPPPAVVAASPAAVAPPVPPPLPELPSAPAL